MNILSYFNVKSKEFTDSFPDSAAFPGRKTGPAESRSGGVLCLPILLNRFLYMQK